MRGDSKLWLILSQAKKSNTVDMPVDYKNLWKRIEEACGTDSVPEIAKKAKISKQGAYKIKEGGKARIDTLLNLCESTGVALSWLLTGVAVARPELKEQAKTSSSHDKEGILCLKLPDWMKDVIKDEAAGEGRTVEEMAMQILAEGTQQRILIAHKLNAYMRKKKRGGSKPDTDIESE